MDFKHRSLSLYIWDCHYVEVNPTNLTWWGLWISNIVSLSVYIQRDKDQCPCTKWVWPVDIVYIQCLKSILTSDLLQPVYRERPMFEIYLSPWGWPDLLQHGDNPIFRERYRCLKSILSPPNEVGRIYFKHSDNPHIYSGERPMDFKHIISLYIGWPDYFT